MLGVNVFFFLFCSALADDLDNLSSFFKTSLNETDACMVVPRWKAGPEGRAGVDMNRHGHSET